MSVHNHGDYVQCNDVPKELSWYKLSLLIFVPAFQISWIITFHCCTVLSTVVGTILQTEAENLYCFFLNGLWEPLMCHWYFIGRKLVQITFVWM